MWKNFDLPFELFLPIRYIWNYKLGSLGFISFLTSILSVGVGVCTLIISLSVVNGFHTNIRNKVLGINPHIIMTPNDTTHDITSNVDTLQNLPNILSVSPFIQHQALLRTDQGRSVLVVLKAIDPQREPLIISTIENKQHSWKQLEIQNQGLRPVIIGYGLKKKLSLFTHSQVNIVFLSNIHQYQSYPFSVVETFESGHYIYDYTTCFINLEDLKSILPLKQNLGLRVKNPQQVHTIIQTLQQSFKNYSFQSWKSLNKSLFQALNLEKLLMILVLSMLLCVSALTIVSNITLLSVEKFRDIGILRSMGVSRSSIICIFVLTGTIIGIIATAIGLLLSGLIAYILSATNWISLPKKIYSIESIPIDIHITEVMTICMITITLSMLASFIPSWKASKMMPIDIVKYD